jgi:para-nitrobenzyl esterase
VNTVQTTVHISSGDVSGTGTDVRTYLGIPYAAPPLGALRWRPPQPPAPWTGIHDGSRYPADPMQIPHPLPIRRSLAPGTSEDCLTLNVWTPATVPPEGAPVIVWFDGGGFITASASRERINGNRYARAGVIFVTVNYRVGLFGFLAHPALSAESPHHASGNYGLLDAIAALRWVRENIGAFGGDAARVTAMGQSAGGSICALLLTSPLAQGLIDRVILRSPGSMRPLCTLAEAEEFGRAIGSDAAAMRAMPAADLLARNDAIDPGGRHVLSTRRLRPVIDGWAIVRDEVLSYRAGDFAAVPAIVGSNVNEGGTFTAEVPDVRTTATLRAYLAETFPDAFDEAWRHFGASDDAAVVPAVARLWGDVMFSYAVRGLAREIAKRQPQTYRYLFSYAGTHTANPPLHGQETTYAFGTGDFDARDRAVSEAMVTAFTTFAATGDPNGPGAPDWAPYDPARDNYLEFGSGVSASAGWHGDSTDFIERFYRSRES